VNEHDIEEVLSEYELGRLQHASPLDCDPRRPWRMVTDAGEYIVRECLLNTLPDELKFEHDLAAWLAHHSYPVSQPVATRTGTTWYERGGSLFAIYTPVSGQPFRAGNVAQAKSAGTALARFHEVASAFPGARAKSLPRGFRSSHDNAHFLTEARPGRAEVGWLVADFSRLDDDLRSCWLEEALLFSDFHPDNVLFTGDDFSGAFDLDCCYWGPRLLDVALSVLSFSLTPKGGPGIPATPVLHVTCGRSFLEGYRSLRPIPLQELHLLPTALQRQVRANALFDLRDVEEHSRRWVQHEWEFSRKQIDLVDGACEGFVEDV
jgi:Ser/Thr protein kinase RdoA (MazF antagonist)